MPLLWLLHYRGRIWIVCKLGAEQPPNLYFYNTGLYHVDTNQRCITATFFKDNDKISTYCRVAIENIIWPQANYLDLGHWAISVETTLQMEIKCEDHSHVKILQPPVTFIKPATSVQCILL